MTQFIDSLEQELTEAAERLERGSVRKRRVLAPPRRAARPLAAAAAMLAALTIAWALLEPLLHERREHPPSARPAEDVRGSYESPFREGPAVPRARGTARRSTLTIRGSTYKLTSGIYGLLGEVRISGDTIEFRSATGYFKLPGLTSAASTEPDPRSRCPGARGVYRWQRDGRTLRFSAVRDPCRGRKRQLEAETWTASG